MRKMILRFRVNQGTHEFTMIVQSDRPRTSVSLQSDATGDYGVDVNVFEPVFTDVETEDQTNS